ncbi:MAG: HAMP domain-containing histidine kinase [Clostridiales bacterium]|nr:HAMP domain-containing histidine kinase [Clostridiales bacterium]
MKQLSIRTKITLWFSAILIVVVAITYFVVLSVSRQIIQKTIRDNLIQTVESNVDEIEYYASNTFDVSGREVDYYLRYGDGYIEIDDDFLNEVNDIYTSLCQSGGTLVYGENPIILESSNISFLDSEIQTISVNNTLYYIFDRQLETEGLEDLWLRGIVSETQGEVELSAISRASLILLPSLVLLAIIGGYLIARRTLAPIRQISDTAAQIRQGGDLKKRIQLNEGNEELHPVAEQFNEMFTRLDDSFTAQQQFVSDASHELRTPVSVIAAQCELTLDHDRTPDEYIEALTVISRQGRKMSRLIRDMLDFTRLELQPERYAKETFDLSALVEGVCQDMAIIQEKKITLTWETESGLLFFGNRELMNRLLTNLISNAYRYGTPCGHTKVTLQTADCKSDHSHPGSLLKNKNAALRQSHTDRCEKTCIFLSVEDDGIGISEKDLPNIFHRFYQADSSRSGSGSGLGLAMVQEIAVFHGGTISVKSQTGHGSTFLLKLPGSLLCRNNK